jgi:hypothetical protein
MNNTIITVFRRCVESVRNCVLIERVSATDKEFHFQNWFKKRLEQTGLNFESGGRNTHPDFGLVKVANGFELKGLAYPGRDASLDSNSQVPTGFHNGRHIYYEHAVWPGRWDLSAKPVSA